MPDVPLFYFISIVLHIPQKFAALQWLYCSLQFQIRGQNLTYIDNRSQNSSVCIVTGQTRQPCRLGSLPGRGKIYFFFCKYPHRRWRPSDLLLKVFCGLFFLGLNYQSPRLTTHFHLVSRGRTCGFILLASCISAYKSFVFTLTTIVNKIVK